MHFEFLVEELSTEAALSNLVPNILEAEHPFAIHPFQGKPDLLANLPARLQAYRTWLPKDWRIVVLIDEDREDCKALKGQLEKAAKQAVIDYRHEDAKRKNIPPSGLAAQGKIREKPKIQYAYNPHLPPILRFHPHNSERSLRKPLKSAIF